MRYNVYQYIIDSAIELPSSPCISELQGKQPLSIRRFDHYSTDYSKVETAASFYSKSLRVYDVGAGLLITGNETQMLLCRDASTLYVDMPSDSDYRHGWCKSFCSNLCLAAASLISKRVPLHAAAFGIDRGLVGIMAPSGTGKTTTLWALLDAGGIFASDDVLHVDVDTELLLAYPSISLHPKLSEEALICRGLHPSDFEETYVGQHDSGFRFQNRSGL